MNAKGYEIKADSKTLVVCAKCHPKLSIFIHHPQLAGISYFDLSHGLCNKCCTRMKFEAARAEFKRTLQAV